MKNSKKQKKKKNNCDEYLTLIGVIGSGGCRSLLSVVLYGNRSLLRRQI